MPPSTYDFLQVKSKELVSCPLSWLQFLDFIKIDFKLNSNNLFFDVSSDLFEISIYNKWRRYMASMAVTPQYRTPFM